MNALFEIDPRPYRAELDKAKAELERAQARRSRWQNDLARVKVQVERHAIGQAEVERVEGEFREADASVKVAEAARDIAGLNLEFTTLKAPFDGTVVGPVLGEGNLVVADTTPLARMVSMDPVFVAFEVDQGTLLHLGRLRREGKIKGEGWGGLPVVVDLLGEDEPPRHGKVDAADNRVNPETGTAPWRAVIPNPDRLLLPGMFVRVRLVTGAPHKALLVPEQAVLTEGGRTSVFIVTGQGVVQRRPVQCGPLYDGLRSVEGLQADEWVVIDHLQRLKEGAKVVATKEPPPGP